MQGGATISFLAMADGIVADGNEIALVTPDDKGISVLAKERGWDVLTIPYGFCCLPPWPNNLRKKISYLPSLVRTFILNFKARRKVLDFADRFGADIIHDNTSVTDIGHHVAKKLNLPHVIHVREYGWKDFRMRLPFLKSRLNAGSAHMIAITHDLAEFRGAGLDKDRIDVVYNGIVSKEDLHYDPDKEAWFFYAGRIQRAKGVADLIDAYCRYATEILKRGKKPLRLKLAGFISDTELYGELKNVISNFGLDDYVDWLGELKDIRSYTSKAAATVIPSFNEAFGRVMPEAMAAGSLCIARDTGGTAEQLENGRKITGGEIALSFSDLNGLVGCLMEVDGGWRSGDHYVKSSGRFAKMIDGAQETVAKLYVREEVGNKIQAIYKKILQK